MTKVGQRVGEVQSTSQTTGHRRRPKIIQAKPLKLIIYQQLSSVNNVQC